MSHITSFNLNIPLPQLVEEFDLDTLTSTINWQFQQLLARLAPQLTIKNPVLVNALLETLAEREEAIRLRINQLSSILLVSPAEENEQALGASGTDLDGIAAFFGIMRSKISDGNPSAIPPIPPQYETDSSLRNRLPHFLQSLSQAGVLGSYIFNFLSKGAKTLQDVFAASPNPGVVTVTLLPQVTLLTPPKTSGDDYDNTWFSPVQQSLPLTDIQCLSETVTLQPATVHSYSIAVTLTSLSGATQADKTAILTNAQAILQAYVEQTYYLGQSVFVSQLEAILDSPSVQSIAITAPSQDIVCDINSAACCDFTRDKNGNIQYSITVTVD